MNILNVWLALPLQKRIFSIASVFGTLLFIYALASVALKPKLELLYSGLDPASAGDVIAKLDGLDVKYEVRGDAIFTDNRRRDSLRLELAREGLPRQSVVGYELFDNMNSFAMSSEMFDTAYWRAKEGELARTLLSMPNVKGARVHLGAQKTTGFRSGPSASSASVTLSTSAGVTPEQAKAIQYLTALSIVGLKPEDVAVIDTVRGLVAGPGLKETLAVTGNGELERAATLKKNLISMLEAHVGPGNARVNVSLEIDRVSETSTERVFDPNGRVLKTQNTTESINSSSGSSSSVTVASNLPEGAGEGGDSSSENSDTSETVTYEISEILRNREIAAGAIKRMTIAVLVSDAETINEDGTLTATPRTPEEMAVLNELVTMASGLDPERGDKLSVRSLPFDRPVEADLITAPTMMAQFKDQYLWSSIQTGILALVVLILGLFVVRPLLTQKPGEMNPAMEGLLAANIGAEPAAPALEDETTKPLLGMSSNDPVNRLNSSAAENPEDAADLLASWLAQDAQGVA